MQTNYTLESLSISRGYYAKPTDPLRAHVKFRHPGGSVEIDLGDEASSAVLAVIADQVVAAATLRAEDMKAAFVEGSKKALIGK